MPRGTTACRQAPDRGAHTLRRPPAIRRGHPGGRRRIGAHTRRGRALRVGIGRRAGRPRFRPRLLHDRVLQLLDAVVRVRDEGLVVRLPVKG